MSDIRQRYSSRRSAPSDEMDPFTPGAGLSAKAMIDAAPQHHGSVQKLHIPVFYSILPAIIQRIILSWSCLKSFAPSWKERHMILCGAYLYKFKDASSTIPKGSPFDIKTLTTDILRAPDRDKNFSELGNIPAGYTSIFTVSTLRRRHYYAVSDTEEADWSSTTQVRMERRFDAAFNYQQLSRDFTRREVTYKSKRDFARLQLASGVFGLVGVSQMTEQGVKESRCSTSTYLRGWGEGARLVLVAEWAGAGLYDPFCVKSKGGGGGHTPNSRIKVRSSQAPSTLFPHARSITSYSPGSCVLLSMRLLWS
jgi:hypothetical protein